MAEVRSKRREIKLGAFYNLMMKPRNFQLPPHLIPVCHALEDTRIQKLAIIIGPGSGKALKPDTPILTPEGWRPIGSVRPGDRVITPDNTVAAIRAVLPQPPSQLYRVRFADGREVQANAQHLWKVYNKKLATLGPEMKWRIRTTEELAFYLRGAGCRGFVKWYVPLPAPIEMPEQALPIHPYVLGAILGDGCIAPNGCVVLTSFDPEIVFNVSTFDGTVRVTERAKEGSYGVLGLQDRLRSLALVGKRAWEKSIPEQYLRGSVRQRRELLQGLMDTDGYVDEQSTVSFCSTSLQLARDVQELVRSLGGIASISSKQTAYTAHDERREGRTAYQVNIRIADATQLFGLERKRQRARKNQYSADLKLEIVAIENGDVSESVCINIADPRGLFLAQDYIVTHNSTLLSEIYPAWKLGIDPSHTIINVSAGEKLAQGFQNGVAEIIERSATYQHLFPDTKPDKHLGWSTDRGIFVTGRPPGDPDASYFGCGLGSKSLPGKHCLTMINDDLHDDENSSTEESCAKVRRLFYNTILGRADPRGCRFIMAGRRWNEHDMYGHVQKNHDWVVMVLPAERPGQTRLYWDVYIPEGLECYFSERFLPEAEQPDAEKLGDEKLYYRAYYGADPLHQGFYWPGSPHKRKEYLNAKRSSPTDAEAVYQCNPGAREGQVFLEGDFREYLPPEGLEVGRRSPAVQAWLEQRGNPRIVQAWDTAFGVSQDSAYTVCITAALLPCHSWHRGEDSDLWGECDFHYDVMLLDLRREKMDIGNLTKAFREEHRKWLPSAVLVEEKASGISLLQSFRGSGIKLIGVKAQEGKVDRAVNSVGGGTGSVQGWFRQWRVYHPAAAKWVGKWKAELKDFTSERSGRKDQVDATVHLVTYAIQQGRLQVQMPTEGAMAGPATAADATADDPRGHAMFGLLSALTESVQNPLGDICRDCRHYDAPQAMCRFHSARMPALSTCAFWSEPLAAEATDGSH